VRPLFGEPREVDALDLIEMRKGDGELLLMAARRHGPHDRKGRGLHRLLSIVDEQNHVDVRKATCDVRRYARRRIRRVSEALSVEQHELRLRSRKRRKEGSQDPNAIHEGREQSSELGA